VGLPTVNFTSRWLANLSDFGLLREQISPKWEILCPGHRQTTVQNLTPLALSSAEKSVTVQTHKIAIKQINKQTNKQQMIYPQLPIGTCG